MSRYISQSQTIIKLKDEHSAPSMIHPNPELVFVAEGSFRVISEGESYELGAGDILVLFPFVEHAFERTEDNLTVLAIVNHESDERIASVMTEFRPRCPLLRKNELAPGFPEMMLRMAKMAVASGLFNNDDPENASPEPGFAELPPDYGTVHNYLVAIMSELLGRLELVRRSTNDATILERVLAYLQQNYTNPRLTVGTLASAVGVSESYVMRLFSGKIGMSFTFLLHRHRLETARVLLITTSKSMTQIAYEAGFPTVRSFNRVFKSEIGLSPSEFRRVGRI